MIMAPTKSRYFLFCGDWWRKWMSASQWIGVLEEWREELKQEEGFIEPDLNVIDGNRFWDYEFEIYYWTHEIEEGRER